MISNYAQLLVKSSEQALDEKSRGFLGNVVNGAARLEKLLLGLQEYWTINNVALALQRVEPNLVLGRALENLGRAIEESGAEIQCDPLPDVVFHETPLLQVCQNLLENALKYRRKGVLARVHVSARIADGMWELSVADNGVGVPDQHRERIFHPFRRLHGEQFPGVGMGLAICARIASRFGGRIWVESNGEGSTFKFALPAEGMS